MKKIVDGNEACAINSYLFTEIAGIYPITPSSTMAELIDKWSSEKRKNIFSDEVHVVEMQSEAGAIGVVHGALESGTYASTYTASQGLLLMIPTMYKMAGSMLPSVIHVSSRSLATHALSIFGDHQDIYATRMTGYAIIASSSVQEAHDLAAIAHLSAISSNIPFLHFFDGFRTSHELQKINIIDESALESLVEYDKIKAFRERALNPNNPVTRGTALNDDVYFQGMEARNVIYDAVNENVEKYMDHINKLTGKDYKPFNYYGSKNASILIVAMGSVTETIKETVDHMLKEGEEVGLIVVHLYRPFSAKYLRSILPNTVKRIAVLDRTKEPGSSGEPLYLDIVNALNDLDIEIIGGRYGLSSKDTSPKHIKSVFDYLGEDEIKTNFTIGINDDVTNTSLKIDESFELNLNQEEYLIWGYGSDGMISASKNFLKIMGEENNKEVQGYFQYDSKKSGGVTRSHLRVSDNEIKSTYYVSSPSIVVVTKDAYLNKYDVLKGIKEEGLFLLNTNYDINRLNDVIPNNIKKIIKEKNIKFFTVDASSLSRKVGLPGKISTIMEMCLLRLTNIIDYKEAVKIVSRHVKEEFSSKGEEVINSNIEMIKESENHLCEIDTSQFTFTKETLKPNKDIFGMMNSLHGDDLAVSSFLETLDGSFKADMTKYEKRGISDMVPSWVSENCINCNICSFVCPHSVIRPVQVSDEELSKMPSNIREYVKEKYALGISVLDCTGCELCVRACPGKKGEKALIMKSLKDEEANQTIHDYLDTNISFKNELKLTSVKGSQFKPSKFRYSGACAGCGETTYIRILTQLFGDYLVIANATGCSSIYGGSAPSTPYNVPWINSLFENNAEFGYGILLGNNVIRERIKSVMEESINSVEDDVLSLYEMWMSNMNDYEVTRAVYDKLDYSKVSKEVNDLKEYIPKKSVWCIGGDGWAYDIGYGGLDHVMSTKDNINVLVLDTEVYSNTGGQSSKSSRSGSIAQFTSFGKDNTKKDLFRILMSYPNVYIATVAIGYSKEQYLKVLHEAEKYDGPSLIIAYSPCIAHGIKGGLSNSLNEEDLAVKCGYFPLMRYNPIDKKLYIDSKEPDFNLYEDFLMNETRYKALKNINPNNADYLLKANKEEAMRKWNIYKGMSEKEKI